MNTILAENQFGHGAIRVNPIRRFINRKIRGLGMAGEPFDWSKGYSLTVSIPIKDQGQSFSCAGQAGAYFLEIQRSLLGYNEALSAKSLYSPIAYKGGGATVTGIETMIGAHGATLQVEVPDSQDEYHMEDNSWQTPELIASAIKRAGYIPQGVHMDIDSIAAAIRDNGGVIIEITGRNNGTWLSPYPKAPTSNSVDNWNHFMCSYPRVELVNGIKTIPFFQSWGSDVGENGVQYLTEEYINSGYVRDCFTFISDAGLQPIPSNDSIWANLVRYFRSMWGLQTA